MYYYLKNISIRRKCTVYLPNVKCFDVIHNIQKTLIFHKSTQVKGFFLQIIYPILNMTLLKVTI